MCFRNCCRWLSIFIAVIACFIFWAAHPSYTPSPVDSRLRVDANTYGKIVNLEVNNRTIPTFISETKPDSKGKIYVFVSGASLVSTVWTRLREELGDRSIAFDREGLGWSELGTDFSASKSKHKKKDPELKSCPIATCAHLIAVVDSIKDKIPRDIVLVGHSLGGAITLGCAPDLDRHLRKTSEWHVWAVVLLDPITPQFLNSPFSKLKPFGAGLLYRAAEFGLIERWMDIFQISSLPQHLIEPTRRASLSPKHWAGFAKEVTDLMLISDCFTHKDHMNFPTLVLSAAGKIADLPYSATQDNIPESDHMSMLTNASLVKQTAQRIGLFMFVRASSS